VCVCVHVSDPASMCVCVHVLSIKHDLHIRCSSGFLCVVCMQTGLPELCILESRKEILWFLSFRSGMHVHS
jgi:hypothetical protein